MQQLIEIQILVFINNFSWYSLHICFQFACGCFWATTVELTGDGDPAAPRAEGACDLGQRRRWQIQGCALSSWCFLPTILGGSCSF